MYAGRRVVCPLPFSIEVSVRSRYIAILGVYGNEGKRINWFSLDNLRFFLSFIRLLSSTFTMRLAVVHSSQVVHAGIPSPNEHQMQHCRLSDSWDRGCGVLRQRKCCSGYCRLNNLQKSVSCSVYDLAFLKTTGDICNVCATLWSCR